MLARVAAAAAALLTLSTMLSIGLSNGRSTASSAAFTAPPHLSPRAADRSAVGRSPVESVAEAQARVQRLQAVLESTTQQLAAGTRMWESQQGLLVVAQGRLAALDAQAAQQQAVMAQGQARLAQVARRMYMAPVTDQVGMAVSMDATAALGMLRTQDALTRVAQGDGDVVRRAQVARLALARTRSELSLANNRAEQLALRSAMLLSSLNALSASTADQLQAAEVALSNARLAEARRLAGTQAAEAARFLAMTGTDGAGCLSSSTAGMTNGNLDASVLCPLWGAPGKSMRTDAARAFSRMSQFHMQTLHTPLCVTDAYRSYARQLDVYRRRPSFAAVPGTSKHGWGQAVDLGCGVQTFNSPAFQWMARYGPSFGFHHPAWAEPSGSMPEPWHWEFGQS